MIEALYLLASTLSVVLLQASTVTDDGCFIISGAVSGVGVGVGLGVGSSSPEHLNPATQKRINIVRRQKTL